MRRGSAEHDADAAVAVHAHDRPEVAVEHLLGVVVALLQHAVALAQDHVARSRVSQLATARAG
jgi:hypothetical protein